MTFFSQISTVLEFLSILKSKGTWGDVKNWIYNFNVLRVRKVSALKVQLLVTHLLQLQSSTAKYKAYKIIKNIICLFLFSNSSLSTAYFTSWETAWQAWNLMTKHVLFQILNSLNLIIFLFKLINKKTMWFSWMDKNLSVSKKRWRLSTISQRYLHQNTKTLMILQIL